ncbi:AraC family transcriptional regulator [Rhizobium tumorigenes]|uniref:AraC family transcriptional regulator n=1 Tax=Rhizobium tumorigenes TaxID=2041385 RepID=A0AAF1K4T3_9HYPH|nr:AraC family transcriptional regulator [Rhizobium tumorigenes]WFR95690.1 AraC family transcriptional regulator [Rhizobium tumorigenes]
MSKNSMEGIERDDRIAPADALGLERSCKSGFRDGLSIAASSHGVERMEARFHGRGFSPHRHDTYALGLTLRGVQTFRYRGAERFSRPGNVIVLHPDEVHDGAAGTDDGLIYRMLYLPPALVDLLEAGNRALPFVRDPVVTDAGLLSALADILSDLDHAPNDLAMDDAVARLTAGLFRQADDPRKAPTRIDRPAVMLARDFLTEHCEEGVSSETLEAISGLDRYELARQFRRAFGTSPHRYLVMRRLDRAKRLLGAGYSLAGAAAEAGFADQAHFTRHFRAAFGMTPGRWLAMHDCQPL